MKFDATDAWLMFFLWATATERLTAAFVALGVLALYAFGPRFLKPRGRDASAEVLEQAAKACEAIYNDPKGNNGYDAYYTRPYLECAEAIRALKAGDREG